MSGRCSTSTESQASSDSTHPDPEPAPVPADSAGVPLPAHAYASHHSSWTQSTATKPSIAGITAGVPSTVLTAGEEDYVEVPLAPRFRFFKIIERVAQREAMSCFVVHDKFILIGYTTGVLRVYDGIGALRSEYSNQLHKCSITQVCIDKPGRYVLTCANDNCVVIRGIGHSKYNDVVQVPTAARSIALAENFSTEKQVFLVGARKLVMYERSLFKYRPTHTIYDAVESDGFITALTWRRDIIAFTNESGTRLYDSSTRRLISLIKPLHAYKPYYSFRFPPRHAWFNDTTLAISWGTSISVVTIMDEKPPRRNYSHTQVGGAVMAGTIGGSLIAANGAGTPIRVPNRKAGIFFEVVNVGLYISGISFTKTESSDLGLKEIVFLGLKIVKADGSDLSCDETMSTISHQSMVSNAPSARAINLTTDEKARSEVIVIQPTGFDTYDVVSEEGWDLSEDYAEALFIRNFHLDAIIEYNTYYILYPDKVIEAKPCSPDDHVAFFIEQGLLREATHCAIKHEEVLESTTMEVVGRQYVDELLRAHAYTAAIPYVKRLAGKKKDEWEHYVNEFEKYSGLIYLAMDLPTDNPRLEPECYQAVLLEALYERPMLFLKLVDKTYHPDIYRVAFIMQKTITRLQSPEKTTKVKNALCRALAKMYAYEREFTKAFDMYLVLKDEAIFPFIEQHSLFDTVRDHLIRLADINTPKAISLVANAAGFFDLKQVIPKLAKRPLIQLAFLNALDDTGMFIDLHIKLCAQYEPEKLKHLLTKYDHFNLDCAIDLCKQYKRHSEHAFLLGRSGDRLAALETIVKSMDCIKTALEFCIEFTDEELWERLIDLTVDNPAHVTEVLKVAGTYVDPLKIVGRIPPHIDIPDLQPLLLKILRDSELQIRLINDCQKLRVSDSMILFSKFLNQPPVIVDDDGVCHACRERLMPANAELSVFNCRHVFHARCLTSTVSPVRQSIYHDDVVEAQEAENLCEEATFIAKLEDEPERPLKCPTCRKPGFV